MATQIIEPDGSWMTPSGVVLILANLAPVAGIFVFDWSVYEILLLFWAENVIVGVLNLFRMLLASGPGSGTVSGQLFLAGFFSVHYGMFTFVHGVFLFFFFGPALPTLPG